MNRSPVFVLVEDHATDGLRSGEGSIVELLNGDLLLFYTCFQGSGDASPAFIARRTSSDGGKTWSECETQFNAQASSLNCMSVSLLRLQDGRIGCAYVVKWSHTCLIPVFTTSADDGQTWTPPSPVIDEELYLVVNNDRLLQLHDGTLVLPYARYEASQADVAADVPDLKWNMPCGILFSKDSGLTWKRTGHEVKYTPSVFTPPLFLDPTLLNEQGRHHLENRLGVFQEPGVQQLRDGRLMMYMRAPYAIYRCFADTADSPWQDCGIFPGMNVCCGPQTIRRLPASGNLIMFYNDRGRLPWPTVEHSFRTPLSIAISKDEGHSWQRWGQLEGDSKNYCYFSLLFFQDQFIASYYESGAPLEGSTALRRNLASLKICLGSQSLFDLPALA